ncbi:uncharacterized protein EI90DRAFT_3290981 [Cantharellus anzutake]|uniref:uncharacterized protein n=1 Tax=Cantharellus anzutake TaxID=1750568 RepID=UPI001903654E|nr:uncharacterized protein EI90DRAFT_3290981 [Cantharellus anzutake]KAF8327442.1 hypothetical protein EI90DRAFT_3290981 [Cantharellus anzutake]
MLLPHSQVEEVWVRVLGDPEREQKGQLRASPTREVANKPSAAIPPTVAPAISPAGVDLWFEGVGVELEEVLVKVGGPGRTGCGVVVVEEEMKVLVCEERVLEGKSRLIGKGSYVNNVLPGDWPAGICTKGHKRDARDRFGRQQCAHTRYDSKVLGLVKLILRGRYAGLTVQGAWKWSPSVITSTVLGVYTVYAKLIRAQSAKRRERRAQGEEGSLAIAVSSSFVLCLPPSGSGRLDSQRNVMEVGDIKGALKDSENQIPS